MQVQRLTGSTRSERRMSLRRNRRPSAWATGPGALKTATPAKVDSLACLRLVGRSTSECRALGGSSRYFPAPKLSCFASYRFAKARVISATSREGTKAIGFIRPASALRVHERRRASRNTFPRMSQAESCQKEPGFFHAAALVQRSLAGK